ncbi:hypothetical protein TNCT_65971 [Trichonephila clavata]|uniref:Uncharacterized protein n=1 Tax=Trichonephila clavata TaxID=2740835 RepID=A0A8X6J572_TRICU|nr:hypothetical protein TNCT_65971 [Trichonephila clavata]
MCLIPKELAVVPEEVKLKKKLSLQPKEVSDSGQENPRENSSRQETTTRSGRRVHFSPKLVLAGSDCCKRWGYERDYYIRSRRKPGSGSSGITAKKRSDLLSFLDSFASSQRPSITNVESGSSEGFSDVTYLSQTEPDISTAPAIITTPKILEHHSIDYFDDNEKDKFEGMPPKRKTQTF